MLRWQLIDFAIGAGGKRQADEIVDIKRRTGHIRALTRHPVGQVADLLIAPMGADEVAVVDIAVIDILARLHLCLQLFDHVPLTDQVMRDLDAGDGGKGRGQHLGFVAMGVNGFRDNLDVHPGKGLSGIYEPLHFRLLLGAGERREIADLGVEEGGGGLHIREGGRGHQAQRHQRGGCFHSQVHGFPP